MSTVTASAPARVNIIGEHTDYNDGLVLPTCTALYTEVTASLLSGRDIRVRSSLRKEEKVFGLDDLRPGGSGGWIEYIKGVVAGLLDAGIDVPGAELSIASNIPLGAGLSSSASLELAVGKALLELAGAALPPAELALLCQRAEHEYAGVHCGIMDQFALACAKYGNALLLDCRTLQTTQVTLPEEIAFILTDSGVRHSLVEGEYNDRAAECDAAVARLATLYPEVAALRDVSLPMLDENRAELGDCLYQRSHHVISENQRVANMVQALEEKDIEQVGTLLNECHRSLRDDYAVSCTELDALVAAANASNLISGSRMVGAGFGGCVLSVCRSDVAKEAAASVRAAYSGAIGHEPWQHIVTAAHPARSDVAA